MSLLTRSMSSGLVLAEDAMDETRVSAALKLMDPGLALQKERADIPGGWKYKVLLLDSENRPVWQVWWADDFGNLLPLSSGILDFVDSLRKDARNKGMSVDEHNEQRIRKIRELEQELSDQVLTDHRARVERGRMQVSLGPRVRARMWQRNHHRSEDLRH